VSNSSSSNCCTYCRVPWRLYCAVCRTHMLCTCLYCAELIKAEPVMLSHAQILHNSSMLLYNIHILAIATQHTMLCMPMTSVAGCYSVSLACSLMCSVCIFCCCCILPQRRQRQTQVHDARRSGGPHRAALQERKRRAGTHLRRR
jgi:hypothetical protein